MIVKINNTTRVYDGFLKIDRATLQYEKFDGSLSHALTRENCFRGDSVAILLFDVVQHKVLLIEQFRYPVYCSRPEKAWLLELPAGNIEKDEEPLATIIREVEEEVHLHLLKNDVKLISQIFSSPGGTSEKIYIFAAQTDLENIRKIGGVLHEGEDICSHIFSFDEIYSMLNNQQIQDAKTVIALQWLQLNYSVEDV